MCSNEEKNNTQNGCVFKYSLPGNCKNEPVFVVTTAASSGADSTTIDDVFESTNDGRNAVINNEKCKSLARHSKIAILIIIWFICSCVLMIKNEKVRDMHQLSVPPNGIRDYFVTEKLNSSEIRLTIEGALLPLYYANLSTRWINVWIQLIETDDLIVGHTKHSNIKEETNISEVWRIPIVLEKLIGVVPEVKHQKTFVVNYTADTADDKNQFLRIRLRTNMKSNFPVSIDCNVQSINTFNGVIYAFLVLLGLYILIISEIIHRTLAAMLASTVSVTILAALNARPTMAEIISWIDIQTLLLMFSMMTIVTIISETGMFDYLSVLAYRLTGGRIWPLINTLCFITGFVSCFLDNVTTTLLMTPVTIRLCEAMKLNPVPVLITMVIYSNLAGAVTPIGDPPNVIIASNADVTKAGINFSTFTLHMGVGVALALVAVYVQFRYTYNDISKLRYRETTDVLDLRREIAVWKKAAASVSSYSKDEETVKKSLNQRAGKLSKQLKFTSTRPNELEADYRDNLRDLEIQYPIRDKILLIKSGCSLCFIIVIFFLHSIPELSGLGIGWTALLGALLLLLLSDREDIEAVFARVEWCTLLFLASLFILMEALSKLGLIEWIGQQTQEIIMSVDQKNRLTVAILLILWVSALASAFVDNIPLTTMMVKIAVTLVENRELDLPLQPLIWALSFGACFGGNGSLFGSSSNIICAGVAEQHGYRFSFFQFLRIGLPITITSMLVITVYLIVCHVALKWH